MADPTTPTPLQQAFATLAPSQQAALAAILLQQIQQGIDVQILQLALDVAQSPDNPYVLGLFRSIYVVAATDAGTTINFRPNSNSPTNKSFPIGLKDTYTHPIPW